jgi:hypothetical protein
MVLQIHFQMRVLKPCSVAMAMTNGSLPGWAIHDRLITCELRSGVPVQITPHASLDQESDISPDPKPRLANRP